VIITDYIGAILGLTKEGNDFTLDPLREMSESVVPGGPKVPRGVGNVVSAEFNMLYRVGGLFLPLHSFN
jgi:linoleate 10R-lipoxygenase